MQPLQWLPSFLIERYTSLAHHYATITYVHTAAQVAREHSTSRLLSPGASALELMRAADDKSLDSHHTTGFTATFSGFDKMVEHSYYFEAQLMCLCSVDVSSFASTHHHSNLGFETSSAQRFE